MEQFKSLNQIMYFALAPMDWITDSAYRIVTQEVFEKYSTKWELLLFTEFMSADWYIANPEWVFHHIVKTNYEKNLTAQIYWWDKDRLIETAKDLDNKYNFHWIELNIGCPSPKVMACGWGAWMIKNKYETLEIIKEISKAIKNDFSIKTRVWLWNEDKEEQLKFIKEASKYCKMISIHWRTYKQWHSWLVDWEFIKRSKEEVSDKCIILWNWWIESYEDWLEQWKDIDWIMVWQAAIWNPWILVEKEANINDIYETVIKHLKYSAGLEILKKEIWDSRNNFCKEIKIDDLKNIKDNQIEKHTLRSPIEFRKHLFSYIKWLKNSKELKQNIILKKNYKEVKESIEEYFLKLKKES